MKRIFIELPPFRKYLDALDEGQELLKNLQETLLESPEAGDLVTGTGGLRKIRVARQNKGKSGGYRVWYLYVPRSHKVFLLVIYAKNELENLTMLEKHELKKLVEKLKAEER